MAPAHTSLAAADLRFLVGFLYLGAAAIAALVVPSEHLSAVVEGYVHLCLKPVSLVARAVYEQNPDEAGLPYALAATCVSAVQCGSLSSSTAGPSSPASGPERHRSRSVPPSSSCVQ